MKIAAYLMIAASIAFVAGCQSKLGTMDTVSETSGEDVPAKLRAMPEFHETTAPGWEDLEAIVEQGLADETYPGAVLIVGKPDDVIWAKAYGYKTYDENAEPMELDSIFDLASVSKVLGTTSAALILMQDGRLSPDDLVSQYIQGFEENGKETVSVRDLMTHTSGLKAYESRDAVEKTRKEGESHADALIRDYAALKTVYDPRTDYKYSCLNFQTTARVTENVSGERMEDLLNRRVYGPLGMKDTVYTLSEDQKLRAVPTLKRADGSDLVGEIHDPLANYHGVEEHCPGNAGLFASATDVARYCEMFLNDGSYYGRQIYTPETIRLATTDQTPDAVSNMRGLGWDIDERLPYATPLNSEPDRYVISHTGYTGTLVWMDQLSDTYMVFFTNRVYPDDKSQPKGKLSISGARRQLAEAVLRHLPEYQEFFARHDMEEAAGN